MRFEILALTGPNQWVDIPFDRSEVYDRFFTQLLYRPFDARMEVDFQAPEALEVRVRITSTDRFGMPWTMSEIRVYEKGAPGGEN
jgi:hypothetical protein